MITNSTDAEVQELKPCPFKHPHAETLADERSPYSTNGLSEDSNWCVYCPICNAVSGFYDMRVQAEAAWNTRTFPLRQGTVGRPATLHQHGLLV